MRAFFIFLLVTLSAVTHSFETQHIPGGLDLFRNSYQCENSKKTRNQCTKTSLYDTTGATPAVTCVDPLTLPTCSCTCPNGIKFNQTLTYSGADNFDGSCQTDKSECLQRTKDLEYKLNEATKAYLAQEQDLLKRLHKCEHSGFEYKGCFKSDIRNGLGEGHEHFDGMTPRRCAEICKEKKYLALWDHGTVHNCFCGSQINGWNQVDDEQCVYRCHGDKSQPCGGYQMLTIWGKDG
jgi:hypothetical protein